MSNNANEQVEKVEVTATLATDEETKDIVATADSEEDLASEDSLTFSNGVIEKIVAIAVREVPGVVGMKGSFVNRVQDAFGARDIRKGVTVEVTPESSVRVNIAIFMEYGSYAPQVFDDVKKVVVDQVTGMTGLEIAGVNLRIEDVLTPDEIRERNRRRGELPEEEQDQAAEETAKEEAQE
ncbi:MAG: Asp23/Gls24 family envelope stress response protein [Coriobacteriales bacterium]|nr:Asp23/Gls24 family envelope stress response protein [Coriobacteriales bacterium]